jgi:xanthine dehydrogenase accessory factor
LFHFIENEVLSKPPSRKEKMWKEFFEKLQQLRATNELFVVGTVVKVSGSTYRRPGARVLITKDGSATGLISGGCFESDLLERAKQVMKTQTPLTVSFDTTSPDDVLFGLGLGCTGVAHILLEPFQGTENQKHLDFISECVQKGKSGAVVSIFQTEGQPGVSVGAHLMFRNDRDFYDNISNDEVMAALQDQARTVLQAGISKVCTLQTSGGTIAALVEVIPLPIPLVIFGAGPDAVPLVRFAKQLGWKVTLVDRRSSFARSDRFPGADAVLLCEPENTIQSVPLHSDTVGVVMTHNFESDWKYLKELLGSPVCYIGVLGPKAKTELLLQTIRDEGFIPTDQQLSRLYAPVGLDIGAETPEEIALAIISEIQAVRSAHRAGFLKERSGPIHD